MCHRGLGTAFAPKLISVGSQRMFAYRNTTGKKSPGVIFLSGFMSNMKGLKATSLEDFCCKNDYPFVRFDYEGTGESPGEFTEQTIGRWKENALTVLNVLSFGPQILIGSSMGGWLACLIAMEQPEKIHSLIGLCPAINFVENIQKQIDAKVLMPEPDGSVTRPSPYGSYIFTKNLLEESKNHIIDLESTIPINCPVRLIHGKRDDVIPFELSVKLSKAFQSKDMQLIARENGDHRLSEPGDIDVLLQTVQSLIETKS